jgi:hypothetical protein
MDLFDRALNQLPFLNRSLQNGKGNYWLKKIEDQAAGRRVTALGRDGENQAWP